MTRHLTLVFALLMLPAVAAADEQHQPRFQVTLGSTPAGTALGLGYTWTYRLGQASVGPTVAVGGRDIALTPADPAPGQAVVLRGLGLQGNATLDLGRDWALQGVLGYRRPSSAADPAAGDFYSYFGFGWRF
jgi:hypothetical protein